jgi:hypothetical protein
MNRFTRLVIKIEANAAMSCKRTAASACWVLLLAGASLARADAAAPVYAQPLGVYAKIDIEDAIATKCKTTSSDHHSCLQSLYQKLHESDDLRADGRRALG